MLSLNASFAASSASWYVNVGYLLFGVPQLVLGVLICTSIVRHRALRRKKEYVFAATLTLLYALWGLGFVSAAVYRLPLFYDRQRLTTPIATVQCFTKLFMLIWNAIRETLCVCVFVIAVDRLILILRPLRHNSWSPRYALKMMAAVPLFGLSFFLVGLFESFVSYENGDVAQLTSPLCDSEAVSSTVFFHGARVFSMCVATVTVLLYVVIIIQFRRASFNSGGGNQSTTQSQREITKTFGAFAVVTLAVIVLPATLFLMLQYLPSRFDLVMPTAADVVLQTLSFVILSYPIFNMLLMLARHWDLRRGIVTICRRRPMPVSTEHWRALRARQQQSQSLVLHRASIVSNNNGGSLKVVLQQYRASCNLGAIEFRNRLFTT